jgi:16S rRNA G527 N7-methylase RsmG
VLRPELAVTLVDSDGRKAAFLREASDLAANVRVKCVRGETLETPFDAVVTRAVIPWEVQRIAQRVGRWAGFLTGRGGALELLEKITGEWAPLPWDRESGVVSFDVPRGT